VYLPETEEFLTLYVDPGETTGWALACGSTLLSAGQEKLWLFSDAVWDKLRRTPSGPFAHTPEADPFIRWNDDQKHLLDLPLKRIVFENFVIYKSKAMALVGQEIRTIRLIGALCFMAREKGLDIHDQPASIKTQAEVGGAEAFFLRPLHDNRHSNDALRHYWYFAQFGPDGDDRVLNRKGADLNV